MRLFDLFLIVITISRLFYKKIENMSQSKSISGFYENLPQEQIREDKYKDTIKHVYSLSGFTSIETPAIERVETLLSKWSDDNEIYGVKRLKAEDTKDFEIWLRFDLTVPLARYIAQHEGELFFPMKVQHIGKSWRWERPQKWRFREFYQADIDIIWRESMPLFGDVDIVSTIYYALKSLDFWDFVIHINNRKLLSWYLSTLWIEKIEETISIIDKKDKVDSLDSLFKQSWLTSKQIDEIGELVSIISKSDKDIFAFFDNIYEKTKNSLLKEWLEELSYLYTNLESIWVPLGNVKINPSISRWLNYYTGLVFETFIVWAENLWSISSWGRYENLCSQFIGSSFPWVWWSIGISRILSILKDNNKVEYNKKTISQVLVVNTWEAMLPHNLEVIKFLRGYGIYTEFYIDEDTKISKQLKYAHNKGIPYVVIYGEQELDKWVIQLKDLHSGEQREVNMLDITKYIGQ